MINKAEWSIPLGLSVLQPRWKSELSRQRPFSARLADETVLEETLFLIWTQPLFAEQVGVAYFPRYGRQLFVSELQVGLEGTWLRRLGSRADGLKPSQRTWTLIIQGTNRVAYQGYQLVTRAGLRLGEGVVEDGLLRRTSLFFFSINASL